MANRLKISPEALISAKSKYDDCSQRMTTLRDSLKQAVSGLRGGWDSDGGKAFFEKFDNTWEKSFNDYIDVISHMAGQIQTSSDKYQEVIDEVSKLNLQ